MKTDWYCIGADSDFFQVAKNIHNSLQGADWKFDSRAHEVFLLRNRQIAAEIELVDVDLWLVHDPQACPISEGSCRHSWDWPCMLDSRSGPGTSNDRTSRRPRGRRPWRPLTDRGQEDGRPRRAGHRSDVWSLLLGL